MKLAGTLALSAGTLMDGISWYSVPASAGPLLPLVTIPGKLRQIIAAFVHGSGFAVAASNTLRVCLSVCLFVSKYLILIVADYLCYVNRR